MLDGQGGEMQIGGEITGLAGRGGELVEEVEVAGAGLQDANLGASEL